MPEAPVLGGQLGVAGWGELALQVLEDVEREAADHGDGRHLPQEGHGCDKGKVCREKQASVRGSHPCSAPESLQTSEGLADCRLPYEALLCLRTRENESPEGSHESTVLESVTCATQGRAGAATRTRGLVPEEPRQQEGPCGVSDGQAHLLLQVQGHSRRCCHCSPVLPVFRPRPGKSSGGPAQARDSAAAQWQGCLTFSWEEAHEKSDIYRVHFSKWQKPCVLPEVGRDLMRPCTMVLSDIPSGRAHSPSCKPARKPGLAGEAWPHCPCPAFYCSRTVTIPAACR